MSRRRNTHPEMGLVEANAGLDHDIELHPTNQRVEAERIRM